MDLIVHQRYMFLHPLSIRRLDRPDGLTGGSGQSILSALSGPFV